jgi:hypothetical protein
MMDDTTVQTIPVSYFLTTTNPSAGVEVMVLHSDTEVPKHWADGRSYFTLRLHKDGSLCLTACGCITETNHWLYDEQSITAGEWTWKGSRSYAIGWHRTGPSTTELRLEARVDELEEELAQEQILHDLTRKDVAACEADIEALKARRVKIRDFLRRSRKATAAAEGRFGVALQAAWAGWSAAILLAAYLIESGLS